MLHENRNGHVRTHHLDLLVKGSLALILNRLSLQVVLMVGCVLMILVKTQAVTGLQGFPVLLVIHDAFLFLLAAFCVVDLGFRGLEKVKREVNISGNHHGRINYPPLFT